MSQLPMNPLSPQAQQRLMEQLYRLLGSQVKSYHKMRRMGDNSSVPVELARELMESMEYTISLAGGPAAAENAETALKMGQEILKARAEKAQSLLELVTATAPDWQTECRWEAVSCLRRYLAGYDYLHLACRTPEELFYPIPVPVPEGLRGVDVCLFYLNVMWTENQIMAAFPDEVLAQLWSRLSADALNQCEQMAASGIGKMLLSANCDSLIFDDDQREKLRLILSGKSGEQLRQRVQEAAQELCRKLALADGNAAAYVCAAGAELAVRLEGAVRYDNLAAIFP